MNKLEIYLCVIKPAPKLERCSDFRMSSFGGCVQADLDKTLTHKNLSLRGCVLIMYSANKLFYLEKPSHSIY